MSIKIKNVTSASIYWGDSEITSGADLTLSFANIDSGLSTLETFGKFSSASDNIHLGLMEIEIDANVLNTSASLEFISRYSELPFEELSYIRFPNTVTNTISATTYLNITSASIQNFESSVKETVFNSLSAGPGIGIVNDDKIILSADTKYIQKNVSTNVNLAEDNTIYLVDTTSNSVTINLPYGVDDFQCAIHRETSLSGFDLIVSASSPGLIDGQNYINLYERHEGITVLWNKIDNSYNVIQDSRGRYRNTVARSSSIISGFAITPINSSAVSITSGVYSIMDLTDSNNPISVIKKYPGISSLPIINLSSQGTTRLLIDYKTDTVIQQSTPLTPEQYRLSPRIGIIVHIFGSGIIEDYFNWQSVGMDSASRLSSFMSRAIGTVKDGFTIGPVSSGGLFMTQASGTLFAEGLNGYINKINPDEELLASKPIVNNTLWYTATSIDRLQANGEFDVLNYDPDGTGVKTLIPGGGNTAAIHRVYMTLTGQIVIQYGQKIYNNKAAALQAFINGEDIFIRNSTISDDIAILVGYIIAQKNTLNLNNATRVAFIQTNKFGLGDLGQAASIASTLQTSYNNSVEPEIITNSSLGAVTLQRGSTSDTDKVFNIKNGSGVETFSVNGNGLTVSNTISATTYLNLPVSTSFSHVYQFGRNANIFIGSNTDIPPAGSYSEDGTLTLNILTQVMKTGTLNRVSWNAVTNGMTSATLNFVKNGVNNVIGTITGTSHTFTPSISVTAGDTMFFRLTNVTGGGNVKQISINAQIGA